MGGTPAVDAPATAGDSGALAGDSGGGLNSPAKRDDFPGLEGNASFFGAESAEIGVLTSGAVALSPSIPKNRSIELSVMNGVPDWLKISPSVR